MAFMAQAELSRPRRFRRIAKRVAKAAGIGAVALVVAGTAASFGYNLATGGSRSSARKGLPARTHPSWWQAVIP
jgi:hypothetical protein